MKRKISYITMAGFLAGIFIIGFLNLKALCPQIKEKLQNDTTYFAEGGSKLEEDYRTGFFARNKWINLYGMLQKVLDRKVIGNMDFVRTENGLMDYVTKDTEVLPFADEMVELKGRLDEREIPLLYIQMPAREEPGGSDPEELLKVRTYYRQIRNVTDAAGIDCMDEKEILSGEGAPSTAEFFFKTDIHTTTKAEIWMAEKIAEQLKNRYQVEISDVLRPDDERFQIHSHPFLGNLAQSAGAYYDGVDTFEEYIPKAETDFHVYDLNGQWEQDGSYEEVLMNGYDQQLQNSDKDEMHTYWITNYLKYGYPAYRIENRNSDGPDLLFICDSLCYRTLSYLALSCKSITVVDPRFYPDGENQDMVGLALDGQHYDAAMYLHGTFYTTKYSMFGRWSLDEESGKASQ